MCGIIGLYSKSPEVTPKQLEQTWKACGDMLETLRYRGPDEKQLVQLGSSILGHTRLSIIDLSTGSQPIFNEDKTIAVVLNGEIYNFTELRVSLEARGHIFRSRSDTEVIVHLYEDVGEDVFSKLNGMFSLLIFDKRSDTILGARDRAGEKPFVYSETPDFFIFASEVKAILQAPDVPRDLDHEAMALYLNSLAVPAPYTIFKHIKKLPPAHYLKVKGRKLEIRKYWDPWIEVAWEKKEADICEEFLELFSEAVKIRTIADVPIGVFLSGGIDSSAVVAFMSQHCPNRVKTFSVGFGDEIDERPYARIVAERFQTQHTELFIESRFDDVVFEVLEYYDEPFGDSSAIPTFMISREARKHVKSILTGDGGDELFTGYSSYIDQKYQHSGRISSRIYKEINRFAMNTIGNGFLDMFYPRRSWPKAFHHWVNVRSFFSENEIRDLIAIPKGFILDFFKNNKWLQLSSTDALSISFSHDLNYYLPDDLLKKVDMASMLTSLECRAPFLDHRIIEFSLKIPPTLKVKTDEPKYIMKSSLKNILPLEVLKRPKTGFGAPVESWMRRQLKVPVMDMLKPGCRIESVIPRHGIDKILQDMYSIEKCHENDFRTPHKLWLLFVLEIWMRKYC